MLFESCNEIEVYYLGLFIWTERSYDWGSSIAKKGFQGSEWVVPFSIWVPLATTLWATIHAINISPVLLRRLKSFQLSSRVTQCFIFVHLLPG
jgi:hypothetical protein